MALSSKHQKSRFNAKLVDATLRPGDVIVEVDSWSPDSRYVLVSYTPLTAAGTVDPTLPGFEIFDVSSGKFVSVATFPSIESPGDGFYYGIPIPSANSSFTQIVFVDERLADAAGDPVNPTVLNVEVYSYTAPSTLTLLGQSTYHPAIASAIADGGLYTVYFTPDNKYIVGQYVAPDGSFHIFTLSNTAPNYPVVSDSDIVVASAPSPCPDDPCTGLPFTDCEIISNLFFPFRLCSHGIQSNFIPFSYSTGHLLPPSNVVAGIAPPFIFGVYRIESNGTFTLIQSLPSNQFVNGAYAFNPLNCCLEKTNILTTSRAAYLPGQPSIFLNTLFSQSQTGKTSNLDIYSFDGASLRLIADESTDTGATQVPWYPDGQTFGQGTFSAGQYNLCDGTPFPEGVEQLAFSRLEAEEERDCHNKYAIVRAPDAVPNHTVPPDGFGLFSPNGQYLVYGGFELTSTNPATQVAEDVINNLLLFRIDSTFKPYQCHNDHHCESESSDSCSSSSSSSDSCGCKKNKKKSYGKGKKYGKSHGLKSTKTALKSNKKSYGCDCNKKK